MDNMAKEENKNAQSRKEKNSFIEQFFHKPQLFFAPKHA